MATGTIILPIPPQALPDGSASNAAPAIQILKSSASAPSPYMAHALFDATTVEQMMWAVRMPENYASSPVMKIQWRMVSATTGNVVLEARVAAYTPTTDTASVTSKAFGSANTSSATSVPGTAGAVKEISISLTNADSLAANDYVIFYLARDTGANDTATGDLAVHAVSVEYTTT